MELDTSPTSRQFDDLLPAHFGCEVISPRQLRSSVAEAAAGAIVAADPTRWGPPLLEVEG